MPEPLEPRTIFDLIRAKMYRRDGTVIDPDDRLALNTLLLFGWWGDGTPITPWQRKALELLADQRASLDTLVPPPER